MLEVLKIEWLKLKNYTAFKVLSIFFCPGGDSHELCGVHY